MKPNTQVVRVRKKTDEKGLIHVDVQTDRECMDVELVILIHDVPASSDSRYNFSDLGGKLQWSGDAVTTQRRIRNKW